MSKEELARQVREAGESLIKNAEDLVGDIKYVTDFSININFDMSDTTLAEIVVIRSFIPEKTVERYEV